MLQTISRIVVIDHRANPKASTGQFELIYKQQFPCSPSYLGIELFLTGTPMLPKTGRRESRTTFATNLPKPVSPRKRILMPKQPIAMEVFQPPDNIKPKIASSTKSAVSIRAAIPIDGNRRPMATRNVAKRPLTTTDLLAKGGRRHRTSMAKSSATKKADAKTEPLLAITSAAILRAQKRQMNWAPTRASGAAMNIWRELELLRSKEAMRCVGKSCALPNIAGGETSTAAATDEVSNRQKMPSAERPSRSMSNLLDVAARDRNGRPPVDEYMAEWLKKASTAGNHNPEADAKRNKATMSART